MVQKDTEQVSKGIKVSDNKFQVGDKVFVISENWYGVITEVRGLVGIYPQCYRVLDLSDGIHGLVEEDEMRKATKLEQALR